MQTTRTISSSQAIRIWNQQAWQSVNKQLDPDRNLEIEKDHKKKDLKKESSLNRDNEDKDKEILK
jgi:hypothetical protein